MTAERWHPAHGTEIRADGRVRFSVWAPRAKSVSLRLVTGTPSETLMKPIGEGAFEAVIAATAGEDYFFRLDGERDRPDPRSRRQAEGVHGPSRLVDPDAYEWTDTDWHGLPLADLALYELHVGTFSRAGTFDGVVQRLPYLRDLGVNAIELMPVGSFSGGRNWGYDGVHPFAPQESYGGPEGLRRLVDAAHGSGIAVILDVVYNHLGPEGNYLGEFGPYFTDRYRTPWGAAVNFDDADSDEVRRYFVDNALSWVTEFHVDGLRLDAVHAIFDFTARHVLEELAESVHAQARRLGRTVHVIAESDLNDPRLVRGRERGGYGLDAQWSDDFHHAVHVALTGERGGYYLDYDAPDAIARALRDRFVVAGRHSLFRRRRHGAPATDVPAERFVVFVQNHDQIGNRAGGERLTALVPPSAARLAASLLLLSPFVPMLFMGEELGEVHPFLYFVSHGDAQLVEAVRAGRRREFEAFSGRGEPSDPAAETTFAASTIDWERFSSSQGKRRWALHRDLLRLRREHALLRAGAPHPRVESGDGWLLVERGSAIEWLTAAFNLTAVPTRVPWRRARGRMIFSSEDPAYDGTAPCPPTPSIVAGAAVLELPPYGAILHHEGGVDA